MIVLRNSTREKLTRRRFLRGAGGAAIALPVLHTAGGSAHAQVGEVPERFIGVFTAQGLPLEVTAPFFDYVGAGNTQPLAALRPFEQKITMVRGVDVRTQGPGRTEHTIGCASFLCGHDYDNVVSKGGTTLDWIIKEEKQLNTPLATLNSGIWGGDDADERGRIVHSWRGLNRPNEPIADTVRLFEYVFGEAPGGGGQANPEVTRRGRYRRSVLDAVMQEYAWARSEASGFGPGVRRLIDNHHETIRDLENRNAAQSQQGGALSGVTNPEKPASIPGSGAFPPNTANWDQIWDIVADIYVLAFRADLVG
jgi:hypothetical protein